MARNIGVEAFNSGDISSHTKYLSLSHQDYDAAIKADPTYWRPWFNKANLFARDEKKYVEAIEYYEKAGSLNPSFADIFNNMGITYASLGQNDSAREAWVRALEIDPYHSAARDNLGMVSHSSVRQQSGCLSVVMFVIFIPLFLIYVVQISKF